MASRYFQTPANAACLTELPIETFKDRRLRYARIAALKANIHLALERSMDTPETLGLESLDIDTTKPPRNHSQRPVNRLKGPLEGQRTLARDDAQEDPGKGAMAPSYTANSIPFPEGPANIPYYQWGQNVHPDAYQSPPHVVRHQPRQGFVAINAPSNALRLQPVQTILLFRDTLGAAKNRSGLESFVRKTNLSVPAYRGLPATRIDKQYRHSKAQTAVQPEPGKLGRWTGSAPAKFQQPSPLLEPYRSYNTSARDTRESTPRARRKSSPSKPFNRHPIVHLPAPSPAPAYLTLAHITPTLLPSPQRLLLVLDLNGTLLYRPRASTQYTPRPSLESFLDYAFVNHSLLIWSSAKPRNVKGVCDQLFKPYQRRLLLGEWGRDTLGLTASQYNERVQVYKRLDCIWDSERFHHSHPGFGQGERWGQHNTLLIDDSKLKASAQPYNHVEVPEYTKEGGEKAKDDVLGQVTRYLEEARQWNDVSAFVREKRFAVDAGWEDNRKGTVKGERGKKKRGKVRKEGDERENGFDDEDKEDGGVKLMRIESQVP